MRFAAWKREKDGRPYLSLKVSAQQNRPASDPMSGGGGPPQAPQGGAQLGPYGGGYGSYDDEIPF